MESLADHLLLYDLMMTNNEMLQNGQEKSHVKDHNTTTIWNMNLMSLACITYNTRYLVGTKCSLYAYCSYILNWDAKSATDSKNTRLFAQRFFPLESFGFCGS